MNAPNPAAGKPLAADALANIPRLVTAYFASKPDAADSAQRVSFGTSGHRGSSLRNSFNEDHILATTQAICDYRREAGFAGPLYVGIDTHALAEPALVSAMEVFAANGIDIMIDDHSGYTPTPVISHAILTYNRGRTAGFADGIVITPSHNPRFTLCGARADSAASRLRPTWAGLRRGHRALRTCVRSTQRVFATKLT